MPEPTLLLGAAMDAASLVLYLWAGRRVLEAFPEGSASTRGFALFWYGVGAVNGLQAALATAAYFQDPGVALAFAVWNTRIVLALASFAGLVYYLLVVYTGREGLLAPLVVFYLLTFLLMQAALLDADPQAATVEGWRVGIAYATPLGGPLYTLVVLMFFVPPLAASVAYGLMLRVVRPGPQRRRVLIITASLAVYFAGLTLGYLNVDWPWWGLVENLLGIGAALGVLVALRPAAGAARDATPTEH